MTLKTRAGEGWESLFQGGGLNLPRALQVGVKALANHVAQVAIFLSNVLGPSGKEREKSLMVAN